MNAIVHDTTETAQPDYERDNPLLTAEERRELAEERAQRHAEHLLMVAAGQRANSDRAGDWLAFRAEAWE